MRYVTPSPRKAVKRLMPTIRSASERAIVTEVLRTLRYFGDPVVQWSRSSTEIFLRLVKIFLENYLQTSIKLDNS